MLSNFIKMNISSSLMLFSTWMLQNLIITRICYSKAWVTEWTIRFKLLWWLPIRNMLSNFIKTNISSSLMLFSTWMLQNLIITRICYSKAWVTEWTIRFKLQLFPAPCWDFVAIVVVITLEARNYKNLFFGMILFKYLL